MALTYKINVLQALKDKGYNTNRLRKEKLLAEASIQSLRESKPISWANSVNCWSVSLGTFWILSLIATHKII